MKEPTTGVASQIFVLVLFRVYEQVPASLGYDGRGFGAAALARVVGACVFYNGPRKRAQKQACKSLSKTALQFKRKILLPYLSLNNHKQQFTLK